MIYRLGGQFVALVHLGFVVFVVAGALLVLKWPRLMWVHIPAAVWGALIEFAGWTCPLTPLENWLRRRAGQEGYSGGFLDYYLFSILYPEGLTRTAQIFLGGIVLVINTIAYWVVFSRKH